MTNDLSRNGGRERKPARQDSYVGGGARKEGVASGNGVADARTPQAVEAASLKRLLTNKFLNSLPGADFERLLPSLEPVSLSTRDKLDDWGQAQHVYFPEDTIISHLVVFEDGSTVETAMTGREGVIGLGTVFEHRAPTHWTRVTLPGNALRLRAEAFRRDFAESQAFRRLLLEHAGRHMAQVTQRGACVSRHKIESRLANWLLMVHDRARVNTLPLTQEFISRRLGTRRAGITETAVKFQERGLISYSRGSLRILDRPGLEATACECYGALRENHLALLNS